MLLPNLDWPSTIELGPAELVKLDSLYPIWTFRLWEVLIVLWKLATGVRWEVSEITYL